MICSFRNTFCISESYNVYIIGYNKYRNFDNNDDNIPIIRSIKEICDIRMINCGSRHVLCLNFNGSIFSFGHNDHGQLGLGKDPNELEETSIPQKIDIPLCRQIACGDTFSICLTEDNLLYSFGNNYNNQCGLQTNSGCYSSPQLIQDFHNIEYIVCGYQHAICKTYDNTYYGWGCNTYGQLGHDKYENYNKPTQCNNYPDNIISIKCGDIHTLLLTLEGNIYSFGSNSYEQLGLGDDNIKKNKNANIN